MFVENGRVQGLELTGRNAQTRSGVGIGDSIEIAERRYPHLRCDGELLGSDSSNPSYPSCRGRTASDRSIYFGGDPIDVLWVVEKGGL